MSDLCLCDFSNKITDIKHVGEIKEKTSSPKKKIKRSQRMRKDDGKQTVSVFKKKRKYEDDKLVSVKIKKTVYTIDELEKIRKKKTYFTIYDSKNVSYIQISTDYDAESGEIIKEEISGGARAE